MIDFTMFASLFILHWLSDYVWQSRKNADAKWNDVRALVDHVSMYVLPFTVFVYMYAPTFAAGWMFVNYLWLSHLAVDYFTSKATHKYYEQKNYKMFFVVLGADQLLHILTFFVLLNGYIL